MSVHPKRRLAALAVVPLALGLGLAPPAGAAPVPPADAALGWLAGELAANDGMLTVTFGTDVFPDPGLTIDAILAELAGGRGTDPAVLQAVAAVDEATLAYVTQGSAFEEDRAANATGWDAMLGGAAGTPDVPAYAAPSRAEDLAGLPPTYIDVGSADTFRDEDVAYASAIWAAGGDAELHVWPGGCHGFDHLAPSARLSHDAIEARRRWLRRVLGR